MVSVLLRFELLPMFFDCHLGLHFIFQEPQVILILHMVFTMLLSLLALFSSGYLAYRMIRYERHQVDAAEKKAFELYDAVFQSFIPRTLGDKLAHIFRIEINASAMTDNKAVIATTKPQTVLPSSAPPAPGASSSPGLPPTPSAVPISNNAATTGGGGTTDQTKSAEKK